MSKRNENKSAIKKIGKPRDIAYAAVYMASDEARFVTKSR